MTPTLGGSIDSSFFSRYDQTVQAALNSGPNVFVIVDVVCLDSQISNCYLLIQLVQAQLRTLERPDHRSRWSHECSIRQLVDTVGSKVRKPRTRHFRYYE